jgi:hypothetical protein
VIAKKPKKDAPLWVRVSTPNREWVDELCKRLNRSRSEVIDMILTEYRNILSEGKKKR